MLSLAQTYPIGAQVPEFDVGELHSTDADEGTGETIRLFNCLSGRTGCQHGDGPVCYAD